MINQALRRGFTVVEITIVIAIIAILSAVSIAAYSGTQEKARQAKIATTVKSYANAISTYRSSNGYWPPSTARTTGIAACIGDSSSYSSTYGYLTPGVCSTLTGASVSTDFNTEIAPYIINPPDLSFMKPLQYTPTSKYGRGIYYSVTCLINYCDYSTTPASKLDVRINYVVQSSSKCVIGTALESTPITGFTTCSYSIQKGATS